MKTDLFQSCGHWWIFQICCSIECSILTASSFRIWSSSAGILSCPLAVFLVMLPKAHLTSHSRMSGFRWVIKSLWLSGSLRSFLYSSSGYSCHLSLIPSASVRSIPFLSFIVPFIAWNVFLITLIFLKRFLVFSVCCFPLFLCLDHLGRLSYLSLLFFGTLHSAGYIVPFPLCFSPLFLAICKALSDNHFAFLHFFFLGMVWHVVILSVRKGIGNPLQYSCLGNPRDGGAWWAAVYGVAQSWTRLKRLSSSSSILSMLFSLYFATYPKLRICLGEF